MRLVTCGVLLPLSFHPARPRGDPIGSIYSFGALSSRFTRRAPVLGVRPSVRRKDRGLVEASTLGATATPLFPDKPRVNRRIEYLDPTGPLKRIPLHRDLVRDAAMAMQGPRNCLLLQPGGQLHPTMAGDRRVVDGHIVLVTYAKELISDHTGHAEPVRSAGQRFGGRALPRPRRSFRTKTCPWVPTHLARHRQWLPHHAGGRSPHNPC